jgi:preprotein translocase subunit SecF
MTEQPPTQGKTLTRTIKRALALLAGLIMLYVFIAFAGSAMGLWPLGSR